MNWLCKLIGHKHKGWDCCSVWYNAEYCLRCNADATTVNGDGVLHHADIVGDSDGYRITSLWCQRCHAMPAKYFKRAAANG